MNTINYTTALTLYKSLELASHLCLLPLRNKVIIVYIDTLRKKIPLSRYGDKQLLQKKKYFSAYLEVTVQLLLFPF